MTQATAETLKALDANIAKLRAEGKDVSALEQKRVAEAKALKAGGGSAQGESAGIVDPQNKDEAAYAKSGRDAANGVGDTVSGLKDTVSNGISSITDTVTGLFSGDDSDDDAPEKGGDGKKGKFRWGKTIAGVIGVALAYLGSTLFGGGWLGTIMFALFAIPAFMMGRNQLGDTFSRWFGEEPSKDSPAKGNEVQLAQAQSQGLPSVQTAEAQAQAQAAAAKLTPAQKIQQQAADLSEKTEIMGFVLQQQANAGRLDPRRGASMAKNLNEARQVVAGLGQINLGAVTEEQAKLLGRRLTSTENSLDRMIANDPVLSVQVMQQVEAMHAQRQQVQQPPAGPVFVGNGNPQTIVGVVPPEAQLQLMAIRQSQQNYQYQPAQPGSYDAQRFNSLPGEQAFGMTNPYAIR